MQYMATLSGTINTLEVDKSDSVLIATNQVLNIVCKHQHTSAAAVCLPVEKYICSCKQRHLQQCLGYKYGVKYACMDIYTVLQCWGQCSSYRHAYIYSNVGASVGSCRHGHIYSNVGASIDSCRHGHIYSNVGAGVTHIGTDISVVMLGLVQAYIGTDIPIARWSL